MLLSDEQLDEVLLNDEQLQEQEHEQEHEQEQLLLDWLLTEDQLLLD